MQDLGQQSEFGQMRIIVRLTLDAHSPFYICGSRSKE